MAMQGIKFEEEDVRANKDMAALGYVIFFLPLITCKDSKLGKYCANQGLLLALAYIAARFVLKMFKWVFIFDFIYELVVGIVGVAALALGIFLAVQLRKHDQVTRLPYIGKYTLIK